MSDLGMMEPSPFDPDAEPTVPRRGRDWEPSQPMTVADLEIWLSMPAEARVYDAWRCMFNLMADDGIGHGTGTWVQCKQRIADPTRSRYCMDHAATVGEEHFSPGERSELTAKEVSANLTRLVPKAVSTLEDVMDDGDAPAGVRAKAADSVLDRTGYAKGVDVRVDAQVAVVDITGIIKDRLAALRESMVPAAATDAGTGPTGQTVTGEVVGTLGTDGTPSADSADGDRPA
jgi:hypothetical protein